MQSPTAPIPDVDQRSVYDLGAQQRAIVLFLWARPGATVREVREHLDPSGPLAYTSVLSVLQKLEALGWVRHERAGRRYRYRAALTRHAAQRQALDKFVVLAFEGDRAALLQCLYRWPERARPSLRDLVDARRVA